MATTEKTDKTDKKPSFAEKLAEKILAELEKGTAPWQLPWIKAERPYNASTGKPYRGANRVALMIADFGDPRYMTFNQAKEAGYNIKKGSKGIPLQTYIFEKEVIKKDDAGKPMKDEQGEFIKEKVKLTSPIVSHFVVFNAEQIDGIPPYQKSLGEKTWEVDAVAEEILKNSGANITHRYGNNAYYSPIDDKIVLPEKNQFTNQQDYYDTALHELAHWTGHESRLNRLDVTAKFGSETYAKEELRAEIASMMIGQDLGITHDTSKHMSYVGNWIQVIKDSPYELVKACNDAERINTYVLDFAPEHVREQINNRNHAQEEPAQTAQEKPIQEQQQEKPTQDLKTLQQQFNQAVAKLPQAERQKYIEQLSNLAMNVLDKSPEEQRKMTSQFFTERLNELDKEPTQNKSIGLSI